MTTKPEKPIVFGKKYQIGDDIIQVKELSFFEMINLPSGLMSSLFAKIPETVDGKIAPEQIANILGSVSIAPYVTELLGITEEQMKKIPATMGADMIADWIELNLSENFLMAATRIKAGGKRVYSKLSKS